MRNRAAKAASVDSRLSSAGWSQASGRIRFAPDVTRRKAAPSWMPLMMGTGMWRVRRRRRPVALRSRTASETSAPAAVVTSRESGVDRAEAAIAWERGVS